MRRIFLSCSVIALGIWLLSAQLSFAAELGEITGRIFTDQYPLLYNSESRASVLQQSSVSLWLEASPQISERWGAHGVYAANFFARSIVGTVGAAGSNDLSYQGQLREGYLGFLSDGLELRAGRQIIPWGKSDGVNPTDYLTAKDYTFLNPDDETRRTGAETLLLSWTPRNGNSPFNFNFIFQPSYPQNRLLIPSTAIPAGLPIPVQVNASAPAEFSSEFQQVAIKAAYLGAHFDVSLSAFRGWSATPQYMLEESAIVPKSVRESAVGADASFSSGASTFRIESALHMPEGGMPGDTLFGVLQPWRWTTVAGIERPFGESFRGQLQFVFQNSLQSLSAESYTDSSLVSTAIQREIGKTNALLLDFQRANQFGATFRLAYAPEASRWNMEAVSLVYFPGGDYYLRPLVGYRPMENVKLSVGADLYGGPADLRLGALRSYSTAFAEAKYVF